VKAIFDKLIPRIEPVQPVQPIPNNLLNALKTILREVKVATTADPGQGPEYVCPANGVFKYDNPIQRGY